MGSLLACWKTKTKRTKKQITPDPDAHRPQRPCAQGQTRAKQEQAQGVAPGQKQNRTAGGATTSGRILQRTKQEGEGSPIRMRRQAGAQRRRHTKQERRDKSQTLQLHAPRGSTAGGGCRVNEEWDKTNPVWTSCQQPGSTPKLDRIETQHSTPTHSGGLVQRARSDAGDRATRPRCIRSSDVMTEDQAAGQTLVADAEVAGGWRVHTVQA